MRLPVAPHFWLAAVAATATLLCLVPSAGPLLKRLAVPAVAVTVAAVLNTAVPRRAKWLAAAAVSVVLSAVAALKVAAQTGFPVNLVPTSVGDALSFHQLIVGLGSRVDTLWSRFDALAWPLLITGGSAYYFLQASLTSNTAKIDKLEAKIGEVETKIGEVETKLEAKIGKLEVKIGEVETKLEAKIGKLEAKFDIMLEKLDRKWSWFPF